MVLREGCLGRCKSNLLWHNTGITALQYCHILLIRRKLHKRENFYKKLLMRGNLEASWQTFHKMWGFWDTYCVKGLLLLLSWFGEYSTMWTQGQGGLSILQTERRGGKSRLLMTGGFQVSPRDWPPKDSTKSFSLTYRGAI